MGAIDSTFCLLVDQATVLLGSFDETAKYQASEDDLSEESLLLAGLSL